MQGVGEQRGHGWTWCKVMWKDEGMGKMKYDVCGQGRHMDAGQGVMWPGWCQDGQTRMLGEVAQVWTDSMAWVDDRS